MTSVVAHRCDSSISICIGVFDSDDRSLCNQLQRENEFSVGLCLFIGYGYGIPELFGREASFIDDRIDRLQPVVGPQNGIAGLVLEIDDVEQILHVGRSFAAGAVGIQHFGRNRRHVFHTPYAAAAGDSAIFRGNIDLFEDGLQLFESLFDRDRMRLFSSRRFSPKGPGSVPGSAVQLANSQQPKNSEKSLKCFITD